MLVPFLIMFREGVEAALIVGIIASYLKQTGRGAFMPIVWIGICLAIAVSLAVGAGLQIISAEFPQKAQELFEAVIGFVAVSVLTSMVFWMRKAARSIKTELRSSIDAALTNRSNGYGLAAMAFLAVAREGLESVFFLMAAFQQSGSGYGPLGALLGIVLAAAVGYGIYIGGIKLNLGRFFRWTGLFILVVAAGILANAVKALHEAGVWNHFQHVVFDLSGILPLDSPLGSVLSGILGYIEAPTVSEATVYGVYLAVALLMFLMPHKPSHSAKTPATGPAAETMSEPAGHTGPIGFDPVRIRLGIAASLALMLLSGASFYYASNAGSASHRSANEQNITVTIASKACDPNEITIPAGQTTFRIVNASDRAVEWEILDGVMVLEERENIAPGFSQTLTARLEPGNYQITCGLLSNPHGTLHVIPSANGASQPKHQPTLKDYIGAMAEYKVYLAGEADSFIEAVGSLADAIHAGHLDEAKSLYEPARIAYAHLSPIAGPISDLDSAIDARADFFENREQDPHFTGLHRIEYGLFHQNSLDGLGAVADQLKTNATALEERIHDLRINPERMIAGSISALDRFSTAAKGQEEDRYAHISLATFNATLVGSEHAYDLIKPVIMKADPVLIRQIDADFSAVHSALDTHKAANGYVADITLSDTQRAKLQQQTAALSSELGKLLDSLRLSK